MMMTIAQQLNQVTNPADNPPEGTRRIVDGLERVFYDGYWIKTYKVPTDSLEAKKKLIEALTRRLFNHTEHGLNIPGTRLNEARSSYESETDPARKRVKGAMLAGALFNRAADIFRKLVELQACGIEILSDSHSCVSAADACLKPWSLAAASCTAVARKASTNFGANHSEPSRFHSKTSTKAVTSRLVRSCAILTRYPRR